MARLSILALVALAVPASALAGQQAKEQPTKKIICTKSSDPRVPRDKKPECRIIQVVPAVVDPTPMYIL